MSAQRVGLSTQRLDNIRRHLEAEYVDKGKIAGCVTLVARKGEVAYLDAVGKRDLKRDLPMETDTIFRIYSMTKPITSVAIMSLYEEGRFQLADPVTRFIPEWKDLRVYDGGKLPLFVTKHAERPISFLDLLTHTSGLTYGFMMRSNVDSAYRRLGVSAPDITLQEMVQRLAKIPLEFSPGTAWNYSVSTDILGHLIEVMSGQPLDEFLQERIFGPLGMDDTGFHVPADKAHRFAANYTRNMKKELVVEDDPETSPYLERPTFLSGGGGLVSTAADYLKFCEMMRQGGALDGTRILGRKTVDMMTRNHLPGGKDLTDMSIGAFSEVANEGTGFGLGFSINLDPVRNRAMGSTGEFAWGGAASTIFTIDPTEDMVLIFLTQLMPSRTFNFRGQLKSIVYSALVD